MKAVKLVKTLFHNLAAAMLLFPAEVLAAQDLVNSVTVVHQGIANIPNTIAGLYYIFGAMQIGSGALKIKEHAESPLQNPLSHGLGRILAGAVMIAMPAFGFWLNNSLAIGTTTATPQSLDLIQ